MILVISLKPKFKPVVPIYAPTTAYAPRPPILQVKRLCCRGIYFAMRVKWLRRNGVGNKLSPQKIMNKLSDDPGDVDLPLFINGLPPISPRSQLPRPSLGPGGRGAHAQGSARSGAPRP